MPPSKSVGNLNPMNPAVCRSKNIQQNLKSLSTKVADRTKKQISFYHEETAHRVCYLAAAAHKQPAYLSRQATISSAAWVPIADATSIDIATSDCQVVL